MLLDFDQYTQLTKFLSSLVNRCLNDQSEDKRYSYLMLDRWMKLYVDRHIFSVLKAQGVVINSSPTGLRECFDLISALSKVIMRNSHVIDSINQNMKSIYVPVCTPSNKIQSYITEFYAASGLQEFVKLILHGSYADNTATAFSDVDDWVLVGTEIFQNFDLFCTTKRLLSKLSVYFQKIDATQHHGHWIFNVFDLSCYERPVMPEIIFEDALSIGLPCKIELSMTPKESLTFSEIRTLNTITVKKGMDSILSDQINHYQLKEMVSSLSLLAPLYFQVNGKILSKKAAFHALDEMPVKYIDAFRWSTYIRDQWNMLKYHQAEATRLRIYSFFIHNRNGLQQRMRNSDLLYRQDEVCGWNNKVKSSIEAIVKDIL